jgi:hypothetical protein
MEHDLHWAAPCAAGTGARDGLRPATASASARMLAAGPIPAPFLWIPANSGTMVQEQTAGSEPAIAAAG